MSGNRRRDLAEKLAAEWRQRHKCHRTPRKWAMTGWVGFRNPRYGLRSTALTGGLRRLPVAKLRQNHDQDYRAHPGANGTTRPGELPAPSHPRALTEALVGLVQDGMIVFDPRTRKFYAVNHCREVVDAYFEKLDADAEGEGSN